MTDLTCHACGATPAQWISKTALPGAIAQGKPVRWPDDARYVGDHMILISTPDVIVPVLCEQCRTELWAIHDYLEPEPNDVT